MNIILILILLALLWDPMWRLFGVRQIYPWELRKLIHSGENPLLLDVRTPYEYRLFHISHARNVPELVLGGAMPPERAPNTAPEPQRTVVVVCMTGHRSPLVAARLKRQYPGDVFNLTWGMLGWKLTDGPTIRGSSPEHTTPPGTGAA